MEQLRIHRKDIYEIEVNDNGDTLTFAMGDLQLPFLLNEAYEEISRTQDWLKQKITVINKQKDSKEKNSAMTRNQIAVMNAQKEAFAKMRKAMDKFLGEGGCQKVFGNANYLEMYNDLFEELTKKGEDGLSHLDRMKISSDSISKRIEEKYRTVKNQVI